MAVCLSASHRKAAMVLSALAAVSLVLTVAVWRFPHGESVPLSRGHSVERPVRDRSAGVEPVGGMRPSMADDASDELKPEDVVGVPECQLLAGRGSARDTALVVVPGDSGTRLAVLYGNGLLYGVSLPFLPHILELGKRADGSVVAGVGDLRLSSGVFREPDTPEPVRIYQDGQLIYETEKAWDFGIASDGSSFYVQEPLAGAGSRLIVRDLNAGVEAHVDLGTRYSPWYAYDRGYSIAYANGAKEIMFHKGGDMGSGLYQFYSVADEGFRTLRVGGTFPAIADDGVADIVVDDNAFMTKIVSSEEGYFAYPPSKFATLGSPDPWRIVRRRFDYGDEPGAADEWSLDIGLTGYGGTMIPSDDGRWLGLNAWEFVLLDAATGRPVFRFPKVDKTGALGERAGSGGDRRRCRRRDRLQLPRRLAHGLPPGGGGLDAALQRQRAGRPRRLLRVHCRDAPVRPLPDDARRIRPGHHRDGQPTGVPGRLRRPRPVRDRRFPAAGLAGARRAIDVPHQPAVKAVQKGLDGTASTLRLPDHATRASDRRGQRTACRGAAQMLAGGTDLLKLRSRASLGRHRAVRRQIYGASN